MAQIIKQRRGSITQLKDVTARISELVVATGSIGNLNGPFLFVGETEGVAGAYRPISKIYQGAAAPTIAVGSYGSVLDGTPFYASGNKSLYILSQAGNSRMDFTGNIEGNTISNVTITSLTGSNANYENLTGTTFTSTNSNITSLTGSNASITNISGTTISGSYGRIVNDLSVGGYTTLIGETSIYNNLYITGNTIQTGSIDLTGNVSLGGNIYIGNQTSDLVVFGGEVSSSILPTVHNAFDLGSPSLNWRNIHVSGTAYVDTLEARQVNFSDLGILNDLTVSGNTYLGNQTSDVTVISGSIYNSQLTNNRVLIAGVDGVIEDDANFTFDATTLKVGDGNFEVDVLSGDTRLSGSLLVKNTATVSGSVSVDGHINLTNEAQIRINDDTLNTIYGFYDGSNILGPYYQMFGADYTNAAQRGGAEFVFDSTNGGQGGFNIAEFNGSTWLRKLFVDASGLAVTGTTTLNGNLIVTGTTEAKGAVGINSTLDVTGSATLKDTLTVNSTSQLKGAVGMNSSLDVTGSVLLKDTLTVNSTSQLKGAVGINSTLDVTGSASLKGALTVTGTTTLNGSTYVTGLTDNRVVIVGTGGLLEDDANFTFDGTVFNVGQGNFEVDVADGDIRTSGSLTTHGLTNNGDLTVNGILTVTGNTQLQSNLYVSGNLEVLGTATNVNLQSSTVNIGDNIILVNAYSPFQQYAGLAAYDSGSGGTSGSLLWDSLNDYWMFVSTSGQSSKLIGTTAGTYGSEVNLTSGTFPIASGNNTIGDSLLTYSGTTLAFNTNKFTIDSGTGDTLVSGNFTLSYSGGTDNNNKTSAIMFKNSSNVVGFVSTTETTDVLDGILGYKNANGGLVFSTVIDGGTY